MEKHVERWTRWATDYQSQRDSGKMLRLQGRIKKAMSQVFTNCNELLDTFSMSLATYNNEVYPDIKADTIASKCLSFMNRACNISLRGELERDTAEKKAERVERMQEVQRLQKQENELVVLMTVGTADVGMYGTNGIYAQYLEVCEAPEYKLLRNIEESIGDCKDITPYYQAVCLYMALEDERAYIEEEINDETWTTEAERQGGAPEQKEGENVLPDELNNDTAKKYFAEAIKYGLMDGEYHWLKTKSLLSRFAFEMSMQLSLNKAESADGQQYASWKPFERLFNVKNLAGAYHDLKKKGTSPKDIELVNKVFGI